MEAIEGGKGKVYICPKNFVYNKEKEINCSIYFRCQRRRICGARVVVTGENILFRGFHNHDEETALIEDIRFKSTLLWRSKAETKTLLKIYENEKIRHQPAALRLPKGFDSVKSSMQRARKTVMPGVPSSLKDVADFLKKPKYSKYTQELGPLGRNFFYTYLASASALLFVSPTAMQVALGDREIQLEMDGAFKISPQENKVYHVFIINIVNRHFVYPLLFVVCRERSLEQYIMILHELKRIMGPVELKSVIADYDRCLRTAVKEVFPKCSLQGCWFHYTKNVFLKARQLGIEEDSSEIRMAMAVPLLPSNVIDKAIDFVCNTIGDDEFTIYMYQQWLHANISVHRRDQRISNSVESYNIQLLRLINRAYPSFWVLIDCLQKFEHSKSTNLSRVISGLEVPRFQAKFFFELSKKITMADIRFEVDGDIGKFLKYISQFLIGLQRNLDLNHKALPLGDESGILLPNDLIPDLVHIQHEPIPFEEASEGSEVSDTPPNDICIEELPENDVEYVLLDDSWPITTEQVKLEEDNKPEYTFDTEIFDPYETP